MHVVAVTGGKGGVGKTNIAVNLAIALTKSWTKTLCYSMQTWDLRT